MSEWVIPVERLTGVPLAIAPRYDIPPILRPEVGNYDWHHALPRRRFGNSTSISALALKGARVQFTDYDEHRSYHHYFDEYFDQEWNLPTSKLDRFGKVVLLGAGYIPELGVRCRKSSPEYVHLTQRQREFMWMRGIVRIENEKAMFDFIQGMILDQPFDLESGVAQEFVFGKDEQIRIVLGNELLEAAADQASESVRDRYRAAYIGKLIRPELPSDPREFMLETPVLLGTEKRQRKTRTALRCRFANKMGVELPDAA